VWVRCVFPVVLFACCSIVLFALPFLDRGMQGSVRDGKQGVVLESTMSWLEHRQVNPIDGGFEFSIHSTLRRAADVADRIA